MFKFLLIILIIFGLIFLVVGVLFGKVIRFLRNPLGTNTPNATTKKQNKYSNDDVLYNKDDVVVLKGDSNNKKGNDK